MPLGLHLNISLVATPKFALLSFNDLIIKVTSSVEMLISRGLNLLCIFLFQ